MNGKNRCDVKFRFTSTLKELFYAVCPSTVYRKLRGEEYGIISGNPELMLRVG